MVRFLGFYRSLGVVWVDFWSEEFRPGVWLWILGFELIGLASGPKAFVLPWALDAVYVRSFFDPSPFFPKPSFLS